LGDKIIQKLFFEPVHNQPFLTALDIIKGINLMTDSKIKYQNHLVYIHTFIK